jgi:hypothetical protein
MLPCIICGATLDNVMDDAINQPSEGTQFATLGHYGSTFWDSFDGEEIVVNICDECLAGHKDKLGRVKRYRNIKVDDPRLPRVKTTVGRQWIDREMVPYFDGEEDKDQVTIEPEEIGNLPSYDRVEWATNWREIKADIHAALAEEEGTGKCLHVRFFAECLDCGAKPLEGLR